MRYVYFQLGSNEVMPCLGGNAVPIVMFDEVNMFMVTFGCLVVKYMSVNQYSAVSPSGML